MDVDPDAAHPKPFGQGVCSADVAGPDAGRETVGGVIRCRGDLVQIVKYLGNNHRAEYFLPYHSHRRIDVDEVRRLDKIAATDTARLSGGDRGSLPQSRVDVALHAVTLPSRDQGPH